MAKVGKPGRNERRKITATALNNLAAAFLVTGIIVPVVSTAYGLPSPKARYWPAFALLWLASGTGLHWAARHEAEGIEE